MRVLSPILHKMVYPALGSIGYFHSHPNSVVNVITYHGVLPSGYKSRDTFLDNTLVEAESFRSQLRLLKKHYNVIEPDQFLQWLRRRHDLPERAVMLTCDDGLLNHLSEMVPILQKEQLKCLFFVTGSSLGEAPEVLWYVELYLMVMEAQGQDKASVLQGIDIPRLAVGTDQRRCVWLELLEPLSRIDSTGRRKFLDEAATRLGLRQGWRSRYLADATLRNRFQLLQLPELKQLMDAGMTVGAHTRSHPVLAQQSLDLARSEISECRKGLEQSLGQPVWAIAYPFGDPGSVGPREYGLAEEAGYECGFVNVGGTLQSSSPRFAFPRIHVTAQMPLATYEAYVSGFHDSLRSRFRSQSSKAMACTRMQDSST